MTEPPSPNADALMEGLRASAAAAVRAMREAQAQPTRQPFRVLYRLVHAAPPTTDEFRSNLAKCLPRRGVERDDPNIWAGLSMFDTNYFAEQTARRFNGRVGKYLAQLHIPEDSPLVLIRQTLRPGHYTVTCCETNVFSFIFSVASIEGLST